jgi:hypothetical protein
VWGLSLFTSCRDEERLDLLQCHCCGASLQGCKKETLHEPKGGYKLCVTTPKGGAVPFGLTGNINRKGALQLLENWYGGKGVDMNELIDQLDNEGVVWDDRNRFAIKKVAD